MRRLTKKRSIKSGLMPGTLVYVGDKSATAVQVTIIDYTESVFQERQVQTLEECILFRESPSVTWINVDATHQVEIVQKLGDCFGIHPLIQEDILNTEQRPKLEDFGDYLYVVLKMLSANGNGDGMLAEQVSLILGPNFVISFQEEGKEGDLFEVVRERLRSSKGKLRKMGADYLLYALLDAIVDGYFVILERLGERIEVLEEELLANPSQLTLQNIHTLKREMIFLRKSVWPLREVISGLQRGESSLIGETTGPYLRDVYDHTIQVIDAVESFRDMLAGMLDIYLSSISNRLNEVMKLLTIIATIFIPLTFIVGLYGMNFKFMPELEWRWGYPTVLLVMVGVAGLMLTFFRRKRWL